MTLSFACAYAFLCARSHPVAALIFAFAFVFVSVAPIYMVQIAPDFFNFAIVLFGYLLLVLQGSGRPAPAGSERSWRTRWLLGAALRHRRRGTARRRDVLEADADHVDRAAAGVGAAAAVSGRATAQDRQRVRGVAIGLVRGQHRRDRRVELPGRRSQDVLRRRRCDISAAVFRIQNDQNTFDTVGLGRDGGGVLTDVLLTSDALLEVFPHNLGYFVIGRHTGFAIYFFPGIDGGAAVPAARPAIARCGSG